MCRPPASGAGFFFHGEQQELGLATLFDFFAGKDSQYIRVGLSLGDVDSHDAAHARKAVDDDIVALCGCISKPNSPHPCFSTPA